MKSKSIYSICAALFLLLGAGPSFAQSYPNKTVKIVVPYPPGGGADLLSRAISQQLSASWGQPVIIENRGGAGGSIGTDMVSKTPPDGYTLLMASPSHAINGAIYKNLAFDAERDFNGVALAASGPLVLVVNGNSPFNSISDFIEAAKKNPGSINYASAGVGSSPHLAGELFKMMAKVDMTHIAYKGTNPALTDLLGGQVQAFFGPVPAVIQHIQSGKLKALGVTTPERFNAIKQVPPIASVVPGYSVLQWWGFVTPAGTPKIVIDKINKDVADILKSPEMMDRLAKMGAEPGGQSPAYLDKIISEDVIKYGAVVKATNLKAE